MAIKPSGARRQYSSRPVSYDESALINGIYANDYILVVGSGVMLDRVKYPDANGDITALLLQTIGDERGKKYRSLSELKGDLSPREISPVYDILVNGIDYEDDDLCPELRRLIESYLFRFVFTTTPDHYLELLMRRLWGDSLLVVNMSDEDSLKQFCTELNRAHGSKYLRPTLLYVFGKAVSGNENPTRFLESDEDAILYIEKWMKLDKAHSPMVDFLKEKKVLGLGCKYEDWYFRFFWYILKRRFKAGADDPFGPAVIDNVVLSGAEPTLKEYLSSINVCVHDDPWLFMARLYEMLTSTDPLTPFGALVREKMLRQGVFLSYKENPDHAVAASLFRRIVSAAPFRVWFDQARLMGGDRYNTEIRAAISSTRVFIPVLTRTVAEVLRGIDPNCEASQQPYFIQEWLMARDVPGIRVIPVAFDGYDLRGPEHQIFESIILRDPADAPSGIELGDVDHMTPADFDKLIKSIYTSLGIDHE